MSIQPDDLDDDQFDDDPTPQPREPRKLRDALDRANAEIATLKERADRAAALEQENALYQANLGDFNERQRKAIMATADGHDPDAYRKAAEELGFIAAPEPAAPAADIAAYDRTANVTAGSGVPDASSYEAEMNAATSIEQTRAIMAKYGVKTIADYE